MGVYENLLDRVYKDDCLIVGKDKVIELNFEDFNILCKSEEILNHCVELPIYEEVLASPTNKDVGNLWSCLSLNINGRLYIITNTLGKDVIGGKDE